MHTGLKPVWAGHHFRLDPLRLPQSACYAGRDMAGEVTVTIDRRGAVVKRRLDMSGLQLSLALPKRVFRGVCARAIQDDRGRVTVTLELLHHDHNLSVPLLVSDDLDDIAADWRAWADIFCLPMMLIESDGIARKLDEMMGAMRLDEPRDRRKGAVTAPRRPRFLARRRMGSLGLRLVIKGREIIARG